LSKTTARAIAPAAIAAASMTHWVLLRIDVNPNGATWAASILSAT
jgi:hypothetical protein